jgi:hypothetical protein
MVDVFRSQIRKNNSEARAKMYSDILSQLDVGLRL